MTLLKAVLFHLAGQLLGGLQERPIWPESMAARTLRFDRWSADERLLGTADRDHWRATVLGNSIVRDNQEAIAACLRTAAQEPKSAAAA